MNDFIVFITHFLIFMVVFIFIVIPFTGMCGFLMVWIIASIFGISVYL